MSQALRDLPDPLLPPPALPSSSPDDLLAKMADEAIDELMAAADKGEPFKSAPMDFSSPTTGGVTAASDEAGGAGRAVGEVVPTADAGTAVDHPDVTTAAPGEASTPVEPPASIADGRTVSAATDAHAAAPAVLSPTADQETLHAATPVPAADGATDVHPSHDDSATATVTAASAPHAAVAPAPAADVRALLQEETPRPSLLLLPLQWINAPFAWIGDSGRLFVGLLGIVTLIPALCAVIYVLFMRGK